ncbi:MULTISPECIES: ArsR family transcriptional regulator [unclassified Nocardia]|uniref:arsenate reductase/protein-tyrosine-phosphatase family protein n=1 Tax=unclassified Nocardia TaxID=2637762 RepID=UPI0024A992C6|nr:MULTISPECIES: ArsR family transcriptional regulator [unclassified Nocardia]
MVVDRVPLLMRMASHPLRWALLTELAGSDRRVRELVTATGEPQNLVSYHLRLLRSAGLVTVRRSSFDGRDSYYHLDLDRCGTAFAAASAALHPALAPTVDAAGEPSGAVLFLCTGNSARSPMAEALLRRRGGGALEVASAGSHPKPALHPNTVRVMRERYGIDLGGHGTMGLSAVADRHFDYVITLCDKVREVPRDHGSAVSMHWSMPDPAAAGSTPQAEYAEFCRVAAELDTRIRFLSTAIRPTFTPRSVDYVEHRN